MKIAFPKGSALTALIDLALSEDAPYGDVTARAAIPADTDARARLIAKERLIVAGLPILDEIFAQLGADIEIESCRDDGEPLEAGENMALLRGDYHALLQAERTALNFLQRLSGSATLSRKFAEAAQGSQLRVLDTRKTTPGWRMLEKYAVLVGGCGNHRFGLSDGVLLKENHIAFHGGDPGSAVRAARAGVHHLIKIEVEVEDLKGLRSALEADADVIMLDDMSDAEMREAVSIRDAYCQGRPLILLEASGNVSLERIPAIAATGVDLVSVGALTHSARAVDISMLIEPV